MTSTTKTELEKITAIFLDGKVVKYPVRFDEAEGWVEMQIPVQITDAVTLKTGEAVIDSEDTSEFHWEVIRKEGEVKVLYADSYPTKAQ